MFAAICLFLLWVNPSNSALINRLQSERRRLIPISFNNKMCLTYNDGDWQKIYYGGDYTYSGMVNNKPSYTLTKCQQDGPNCKHGKTLSIGTNGNWYIGGQNTREGSDPFCNDATNTPADCNNWWDGATHFEACGTIQTADNGLTPQENELQTPVGNSLSSADKQALLDAHNAVRRKTALGQMNGGYTPSASDMIKFKWDDGLAYIAQKHSDGCIFQHTNGQQSRSNLYYAKSTMNMGGFPYGSDRVNDNVLGNVGENLAGRGFKTRQDLVNAISGPNGMAEIEAKNWYWNAPNVDHYNQMVASHTQYVGCGINQCDNRLPYGMLTCNYYPYYGTTHQHTYLSGQPGSECPDGTSYDGNGLCESSNLIFPYTH